MKKRPIGMALLYGHWAMSKRHVERAEMLVVVPGTGGGMWRTEPLIFCGIALVLVLAGPAGRACGQERGSERQTKAGSTPDRSFESMALRYAPGDRYTFTYSVTLASRRKPGALLPRTMVIRIEFTFEKDVAKKGGGKVKSRLRLVPEVKTVRLSKGRETPAGIKASLQKMLSTPPITLELDEQGRVKRPKAPAKPEFSHPFIQGLLACLMPQLPAEKPAPNVAYSVPGPKPLKGLLTEVSTGVKARTIVYRGEFPQNQVLVAGEVLGEESETAVQPSLSKYLLVGANPIQSVTRVCYVNRTNGRLAISTLHRRRGGGIATANESMENSHLEWCVPERKPAVKGGAGTGRTGAQPKKPDPAEVRKLLRSIGRKGPEEAKALGRLHALAKQGLNPEFTRSLVSRARELIADGSTYKVEVGIELIVFSGDVMQYRLLLDTWEKHSKNKSVVAVTLNALARLLRKQQMVSLAKARPKWDAKTLRGQAMLSEMRIRATCGTSPEKWRKLWKELTEGRAQETSPKKAPEEKKKPGKKK
jgi:hypothetical protein